MKKCVYVNELAAHLPMLLLQYWHHVHYPSFFQFASLVLWFMGYCQTSVLFVPITEDKTGKEGSLDNYRPRAFSRILLKVLEKILPDRLHRWVYWLNMQSVLVLTLKYTVSALKEMVNKCKSETISFYVLYPCFQSIWSCEPQKILI